MLYSGKSSRPFSFNLQFNVAREKLFLKLEPSEVALLTHHHCSQAEFLLNFSTFWPKFFWRLILTCLSNGDALLDQRRPTTRPSAAAEEEAVQAVLLQSLDLPLGGVSYGDVYLPRVNYLHSGLINYRGSKKVVRSVEKAKTISAAVC